MLKNEFKIDIKQVYPETKSNVFCGMKLAMFVWIRIICIIINFLQSTDFCKSSKTVKDLDYLKECSRQEAHNLFSFIPKFFTVFPYSVHPHILCS